jgi:hypothetical protein
MVKVVLSIEIHKIFKWVLSYFLYKDVQKNVLMGIAGIQKNQRTWNSMFHRVLKVWALVDATKCMKKKLLTKGT